MLTFKISYGTRRLNCSYLMKNDGREHSPQSSIQLLCRTLADCIAAHLQTILFCLLWSYVVTPGQWYGSGKFCMILLRYVLKKERVCSSVSLLYLAAWNLNVTRATSSNHTELWISRHSLKNGEQWVGSSLSPWRWEEAICFCPDIVRERQVHNLQNLHLAFILSLRSSVKFFISSYS